jgi:ParB family chromosome partitioning protein
MSLKNKAAKIDLTNLGDDAAEGGDVSPGDGASVRQEEYRPVHVRGRSGVAAITSTINAQHRIQDLEEEVAALKSAQVVVKLDPGRVRQSRWKNRDELSFATKAYADLKQEISDAGGNVQPIKVRRVTKEDGGEQEYEVVFGRRRLRACLELGLAVNAVIEDMNDMTLFIEMERENRNREDLSPWEQGVMYKHGLDAGLFPSQRQMASALGVNLSMLSTSVRLASLPVEVVEAFPSPLEIQFRWAQPLLEALEKDAVRVTSAAQELVRVSPRPSSKEVLNRLVNASAGAREVTVNRMDISAGGRVVGTIEQNKKGAISLKVVPGVLDQAGVRRLGEALTRLAEGR